MNPVVPGSSLLVLKLALSLGLVVGLILLLQKAARKWGHTLRVGNGPEAIRLVSQRSLGPRLSLAVVEVRGRTLLVGISPQGIQTVADLDLAAREGAAWSGAPAAAGPAGRPASAAMAAGRSEFDSIAASPRPDTPPRRGWLTRFGLRPAGAASFAAGATRSSGLGGPSPRRGPAVPLAFEDELSARLASLRDRYPTLADLETGDAEARR